MATSDKLNKILDTKAAIRNAIIDKGVEVGEDVVFADYPSRIAAIQTGSGEGGSDDFFNARTQNGTNMDNLFYGFNGEFDFSSLDTSNAIRMNSMFYYCGCTELDLSSWDTSNVTRMNSMFQNCQATKIDIRNFDLSKVGSRNLGNMLFCYRLRELRLDNCSYDTISKIVNNAELDTSALFDYEIDPETNLPDPEKEIIIQRKIYVNPDNIEGLAPPENWIFVDLNGNEIILPYVAEQFAYNENIIEVSTLVTSEHTNLFEMFAGCVNLTTVHNMENWDTSNVTDMCFMFSSCSNLASLDVSNFNTSKVEYMGSMFFNCESLTSLNVSNFDTSNVIDMGGMFSECYNLTTIDVSNFNTSNVEYMSGMFYGCTSLTELDLSNFDTSKVTDMNGMFMGCNNLQILNLSNFNTESIESTDCVNSMFCNCDALHTIRFDNCSNDTINNIINGADFPTNAIDGVQRKIYVQEANITGLTPPTNWVFEYVE